MNVPNIIIVRESPEKSARLSIIEATPRKRCKVSEVAVLLAPQFSIGDDVHAVKWLTEKSGVSQSAMSRDAKRLHAVLLTVTRENAKRAADAISQLLLDEKNADINKNFYEASQQNLQPGSSEKQTK